MEAPSKGKAKREILQRKMQRLEILCLSLSFKVDQLDQLLRLVHNQGTGGPSYGKQASESLRSEDTTFEPG